MILIFTEIWDVISCDFCHGSQRRSAAGSGPVHFEVRRDPMPPLAEGSGGAVVLHPWHWPGAGEAWVGGTHFNWLKGGSEQSHGQYLVEFKENHRLLGGCIPTPRKNDGVRQ